MRRSDGLGSDGEGGEGGAKFFMTIKKGQRGVGCCRNEPEPSYFAQGSPEYLYFLYNQ